jgi:ribA/ribD-fused uncharacterized protein
MIDSFRGDYRFLSNFYMVGNTSVEHQYQAAKTDDLVLKAKILACEKPGEAKRMGHGIEPPDWKTRSLSIMYKLVKQKFNILKLRERLLATGNEELCEGNNWHDNFWGACICADCADKKKFNHLGKILMQVREEARQGGV